MRTRTWLGGAAAVLLVVGVLGTRSQSAATDADLAVPEPVPSPSAVPTPEPSDDVVLLGADGLEGMRLGSPPLDAQGPFTGPGTAAGDLAPEDLPGGCEPVWPMWSDGAVPDWQQQAWVVDGRVQSVFLTLWDHSEGAEPTLRTWLGPTLGSPMEAAAELPGASTTSEQPFGADGPTVTVVHVAVDGVEVVFSDAGAERYADVGFDDLSGADAQVGRIGTLEVRLPRAGACSTERLQQELPGRDDVEDPIVAGITRDGVGEARLGTPSEQVRALPGALGMGVTSDGCEAIFFPIVGDGYVRVVAVDGLVAMVEADGVFSSDLGVASGDGVAEVHAAFPQLAEQGQPVVEGLLEVPLDDRVVSVGLWREQRWVPDVEVPVTGGPPVVRSLGVRVADVSPSSVGC